MKNDSHQIYKDPVALVQKLIRFDTTNPPGDEAECVAYIKNLLDSAGIESQILAKDPTRPNLVARVKGTGNAPPILLYGHVDVVTTAHQEWAHPPFEGKVVDGFVWGRGALDMKSGVTMMVSSFIRAKVEELQPAGDIILAILSDEENGGDLGARFLVEEHGEQFEGARYALGEFGGATMHLNGHRYYPIQIAEKQMCWMIARVRGPGGHGARPLRGGAMARLAHFLSQLDESRLPLHETPVTKKMVEIIGQGMSDEDSATFKQILDPDKSDAILEKLGELGVILEPLLHNTVNATIVRGGDKINVIPSEIEVELDGRLLPGFFPEQMISELQEIAGDEVELEVKRYESGPKKPDLGLFELLAGVLEEADPGCQPMPLLLAGVTDGRFFSKLGIQTYGFTPMKLPEGFKMTELVHAANERIPAEAVIFGSNTVYSALKRYKG
jgi:acetylornithine deacetylase/succinyl-diaminopimelate desuccinylase-like protein